MRRHRTCNLVKFRVFPIVALYMHRVAKHPPNARWNSSIQQSDNSIQTNHRFGIILSNQSSQSSQSRSHARINPHPNFTPNTLLFVAREHNPRTHESIDCNCMPVQQKRLLIQTTPLSHSNIINTNGARQSRQNAPKPSQ